MGEDVLLRIGRVVKTHGIAGAFLVAPETDDLNNILDLKSVLVGKSSNSVREFVVADSYTHHVKKHVGVVIKTDSVTSVDEASQLKGLAVYAREDELPALDDGSYFLDDLPGLSVVNSNGERIGVITEWVEYPSQIMLVVEVSSRKVLIPLVVPEIVSEVGIDSGRIILQDWEGLIDDN